MSNSSVDYWVFYPSIWKIKSSARESTYKSVAIRTSKSTHRTVAAISDIAPSSTSTSISSSARALSPRFCGRPLGSDFYRSARNSEKSFALIPCCNPRKQARDDRFEWKGSDDLRVPLDSEQINGTECYTERSLLFAGVLSSRYNARCTKSVATWPGDDYKGTTGSIIHRTARSLLREAFNIYRN